VQPYLRHGTPMFPWRSLARIARELPASRHRGCDSPIHQARSKTTQRLGQGFAPESRSHLDARPPGPCCDRGQFARHVTRIKPARVALEAEPSVAVEASHGGVCAQAARVALAPSEARPSLYRRSQQ
jgi:hypothetical protein